MIQASKLVIKPTCSDLSFIFIKSFIIILTLPQCLTLQYAEIAALFIYRKFTYFAMPEGTVLGKVFKEAGESVRSIKRLWSMFAV